MRFDRLVIDGIERDAAGTLRYLDELARNSEDPSWAERLHGTAEELMRNEGLVATTSGTTGPSKRMLIPPTDLLASARLTAETFDLRPGDRVLHCLPAEYVAGKVMLARAFALGLDVRFIDPRGGILTRIAPHECFRFAAMVPVQLHRALEENRARVEQQFETILLGGGPVSDALEELLHGLRTRIVLGYGSTEMVTHVALRDLNGERATHHFTALGDCHFARDPRGCLVAFTPHLSVGQHLTNDLVELIDDTRFRWLGRYDNVILSGGKKIYPEQLEARTAGLLPYPHFFSPTPDEALGQAVMLTIESDRPKEELVSEVMGLLMPHLHPHEWPRRVIVLPRIARTASGKLIRG